jgi:tryptophan synthase beta chain
MANDVKILLGESELPQHWYNLAADLPERLPPPLHPITHKPLGYDDMSSLTPRALTLQETTTERYIEIPDDVLRAYRQWRPTPMFRAYGLEKALGTPARIYYKYEGGSATGSHKVNSAIPQAYYNAERGTARLTTETGAGQWGTALAYACAQFGVGCEVWWAGSSFDQKPYRRIMMEAFGGTVHRSPSPVTDVGRKALAENPDSDGSIGLAVSEAVEVALADPGTGYALGSAVNHVLLHQTIIGEELLRQFAIAEDFPDVMISCVGGGSSLGGMAFPFLREKITGGRDVRIVAAEPTACPALTRGRYAFDHGDREGMTPLMKMYTIGHKFIPDPIHAGGLRYHGMAPLVSYAYDKGLIEAGAWTQTQCFTAGLLFARTEGIMAAPESTHGLAACVAEAQKCTETGEEKAIFVLITGHGHFDLAAYDAFLSGELVDTELSEESLQESLAQLPDVAPLRMPA